MRRYVVGRPPPCIALISPASRARTSRSVPLNKCSRSSGRRRRCAWSYITSPSTLLAISSTTAGSEWSIEWPSRASAATASSYAARSRGPASASRSRCCMLLPGGGSRPDTVRLWSTGAQSRPPGPSPTTCTKASSDAPRSADAGSGGRRGAGGGASGVGRRGGVTGVGSGGGGGGGGGSACSQRRTMNCSSWKRRGDCERRPSCVKPRPGLCRGHGSSCRPRSAGSSCSGAGSMYGQPGCAARLVSRTALGWSSGARSGDASKNSRYRPSRAAHAGSCAAHAAASAAISPSCSSACANGTNTHE
mmetsp:Transcript_15292/g.49238  ORF Transcript_15292/g.49238 Transcript_15292/m.49238 type:complete len:305 (+) Transcript_15292:388-1302(+)